MSELAVRARPLLGFYQGHRGAGQRESVPDVARLFSALVHAAGTGTTAVEDQGVLLPSPEARSALQWLEQHPPTMVHIPPLADGYTGARAFRDEGVLEGKTATRRKVNKAQGDGFGVNGYFGWAWQEDVSAEIVATIDALCADVAYLGEVDSPFTLEVAPIEPTHQLDPNTSAFARSVGHEQRVPVSGRLEALEARHSGGRPARKPTVSQDKATAGQLPLSAKPQDGGLVARRYRPIAAEPPDLPWTRAVALIPGRPVPEHERVRWAVTLHRALIAQIGDGAPAVLTGAYPKGAARPANRVAIQYVSGPTQVAEVRAGAFLVMLPAGLSAVEQDEIVSAAQRVRGLYRGGSSELNLRLGPPVELDHVWLPPLPGTQRRWEPRPAFVPETRRQRGTEWSLESALRLSVGFAFRGQLELGRERGQARYERIVAQVEQWGVSVISARAKADSRVERYVHRMPEGLTAQPVEALLDLGDLVSSEAFLALGQSRHLGGGALYPVDTAEVIA